MNKNSQNNLTTPSVLKSKNLERERQKTIPMRQKIEKNGKLTDLCTEQKIKIGELIRTLQARRIENSELHNDNERLREHICQCQTKLDQMENQSFQKESQIGNLKDKIAQLTIRIDLYQQKLSEMNEVIKTSTRSAMQAKGVQTEYITTKIASCQTLMIGQKQHGSQTVKQNEQISLLYQTHSKSFEKIMKGIFSRNLHLGQRLTSEQASAGKDQSSCNKSRGNNCNAFSKSSISNSSSHSFEEINEKWNLLKLKNQAELAKSKQLNSVHEFDSPSASKEGASQDSQSLVDIDGITLNRMLRKKDFSANLVMKKEKLPESKKDSHQVSYLKSPYFNRLEAEHPQLKPLTSQSHKKSKNKPSFHLNFYESGLSEMGSSLR